MLSKLGKCDGGRIMNREEILEKSRKANIRKDEMESYAIAKAGQMAFSIGGIVCMVVLLVENFISGHVNTSLWTVYLSMRGTSDLVEYQYLKDKKTLRFAVINYVLAIVFFVLGILQLIVKRDNGGQ